MKLVRITFFLFMMCALPTLVCAQVNSSSKLPLIVIDPGHGGEDIGARGPDGLLEKNVTLNIAKDIEELIKERKWSRVILTRTEDKGLSLKERTEFANKNNADLFVSIHTNASEYKTFTGGETYYLDNTDDLSSLRLANRENFAGEMAQASDLNFIVSDLIQNAKLDDSIKLTHKIHLSMVKTLQTYYEGVKDLGVKKAPFYVLVGAHMPCVLVEVSFIDHPSEGRRLGERRYQRLIAQAVYDGLKEYFDSQAAVAK